MTVIFVFAAFILLLELLYPRWLFLGLIHEHLANYQKAEEIYKEVIKKYPHSKRATLKLVSLYKHVGEPQKAKPYLKALFEYRLYDWDMAMAYLYLLKTTHDDEELYLMRLKVADTFESVKGISREQITALLDDALEYALWNQRIAEAYKILNRLILVSNNPDYYFGRLEILDRSTKKTSSVLVHLDQKLKKNPDASEIRTEMAGIYTLIGKYNRARTLLVDGLKDDPQNKNFLKMKIYLEYIANNFSESMKALVSYLDLESISDEERQSYSRDLASLKLRSGDVEGALSIYNKILHSNFNNSRAWQDVLFIYLEREDNKAAISLLHKYLRHFPHDTNQWKNLAHIYLYKMKDASQFNFYLTVLKKYPQLDYAADVANFYLEKSDLNSALKWLHAALSFYPDNDQLIRKTAQVYARLRDRKKAAHFYKLLANIHPTDHEVIKECGKESYFLGEFVQADEFLKKSAFLSPLDPEPWFWISELKAAAGKEGESKQAALAVLAAIAKQKPRDEINHELTRMQMKAHARIKFTRKERLSYANYLKKNPDDFAVSEDYMDLLLDHGKTAEAASTLELASKNSQADPQRIRHYESRLHLARKHWAQAIAILENRVTDNPADLQSRLDLAYALVQDGQWIRGMQEYEISVGDSLEAQQSLALLHERYDHRIGSQFKLTDLGSDEMWQAGIAYRGFLNQRWEIGAEVDTIRYHAGDLNRSGQTEAGEITTTAHFKPVSFKMGVGFGINSEQKTLSPLVRVIYRPIDQLKLSTGFELRKLRRDIPQAQIFGDLQDKAIFDVAYQPAKRLNLSSLYAFNRDKTNNGATAKTHEVTSDISYKLLNKPQLEVGYRHAFGKVSASQDFLNQIPLVPRHNSHLVNIHVGHQVTKSFYAKTSFFAGEDTARNLHLFKGDLFGTHTEIKWKANSWLDLNSAYDFSQETIIQNSQSSHTFNIGLSGHW